MTFIYPPPSLPLTVTLGNGRRPVGLLSINDPTRPLVESAAKRERMIAHLRKQGMVRPRRNYRND